MLAVEGKKKKREISYDVMESNVFCFVCHLYKTTCICDTARLVESNNKKKKERVSGVEEREKFLKSDQKIWVSVYP